METNNATLATLLDAFMEALATEHHSVHFLGGKKTNNVNTAYDAFANALKKLPETQREIFWQELAGEKSYLVSGYCTTLEYLTKHAGAKKHEFYGLGSTIPERLLAKLAKVAAEVKPVEKLPEKIEVKVEPVIMQPVPEYVPQDVFVDSLRFFPTLPTEADHNVRAYYRSTVDTAPYFVERGNSYNPDHCPFIENGGRFNEPSPGTFSIILYEQWGQPDYIICQNDPEEWEAHVWFRNWFSTWAWFTMYGGNIPGEYKEYSMERFELENKIFNYNLYVKYFSMHLVRCGAFPHLWPCFPELTQEVMEDMTQHYVDWATANLPGYVPPVPLSEKPAEKAPEVEPEISEEEAEIFVQNSPEVYPENFYECEVEMEMSEERNTRWEAEQELRQQLKAEETSPPEISQEFSPDLAAFLARNRHMSKWLPFFPETLEQAHALTLVSDLPQNAQNFTDIIAAYLKTPATAPEKVSVAPQPVEVCVSTSEIPTSAPVVLEDEWSTPEKIMEIVEEVQISEPRFITPADTERLLERKQNAHDRLVAFGPAVKKYDKVLLAVRALVHELGQAFNRAQMGEEAVPPACLKVLVSVHDRFRKEWSELGPDGIPGFWAYLYHMHSSAKTGWKKFGKVLNELVSGCTPNCSTYWGIDAVTVTMLSGKFAKWNAGVDCPAFPSPQVEEKPEEIKPAGEEFFQHFAETLSQEETEGLEDIFLPAPEYSPETSGNQQAPEEVTINDTTHEEIMEPTTVSLANVAEVARYLTYPPVAGSLTTMQEVEAYREASRKFLNEMDLTHIPERLRSAKNFPTIMLGFVQDATEIVEQQCQAAIDYYHLTPSVEPVATTQSPLEYVEASERFAEEYQVELRELNAREQAEVEFLTNKLMFGKRTYSHEEIQEKVMVLRLKFETRREKLHARHEKLQAKLEAAAQKAAAKAQKDAEKLAKLEAKAAAKAEKAAAKAAKEAEKEAIRQEKAAAKAAKAAAKAEKLVEKGAAVLDDGAWRHREFRPTIPAEATQELEEYAEKMGLPIDHHLVEARRFFLYVHTRGLSHWAAIEKVLEYAKAEELDVVGAIERNVDKGRGHVSATLGRPTYDMGFSHRFNCATPEQQEDVKNAYEAVHAHNPMAAGFAGLTSYEKGVLTYHFLYETGNFAKKARVISAH